MLADVTRLTACSICWAAIIILAIPAAVLLIAVLFFVFAMDVINENL